MAFGKITVATENGELEEHELARPTMSVGRQPGNDIVLNSSAVSRYHAQFDVYGGQVFLVDLGTVNGTYVNDQQVDPNSRNPLNDGDVVMLGDVRLVFSATKARPGGTGLLALNPRVHENPDVPIRLTLDDPDLPVAPGAFLQLALIIENHSGLERLFTIQTEGMDAEWLKINRREVRLEDDEQTEVMISVRPPRLSTTRPARYPLTIRVAYKDDSMQSVEAHRDIEVLGFSGIAMAIREGKGSQYSIALQNQGNHPHEIYLSGYQRDGELAYQFEPDHMWIDPGDTAQVRLRVRATRSVSDKTPFAVVARSGDVSAFQAPLVSSYSPGGTPAASSASGSGRAVVVAGLGIPALFIIGLVVALVAVGGLWALGYIQLPFAVPGLAPATATAETITATPEPPTPTPQPTALPTPAIQLLTFDAEPRVLTFGTQDKVVFTWQVDGMADVAQYFLFGDLQQPLPLTPADWVTGHLEMKPGALVLAFGWGEHPYRLTVVDKVGNPSSLQTTVKIDVAKCQLNAGTPITDVPGPSGTPIPPTGEPPVEVVIGGKTVDDAFYLLWSFGEHRPLGWAPVTGVLCVPVPPIGDFVVIEP